jgi:hypothetical protein
MSAYPRPCHLITKRPASPLGVIACGRNVSMPSQYTNDPAKSSCHECAREAEGLTAQQRNEIWDNANERMEKFKRSPWADQFAREAKASA